MGTLRNWLGLPIDLTRLFTGWLEYRRSGQTPNPAYQSMIRLFCTTRGYSNDLLSRMVSLTNPPVPLPPPRGVLGDLSPDRLHRAVSDLRTEGFHVFDQRLPSDLCDRLLDYCVNHQSTVRTTDGSRGVVPRRAIYERARPLGPRYDFETGDILAVPDMQRLLGDASLLAVAQAYLQCRPVLDVIGLWWHTAFSQAPDKEAAQFFHFDMDRVKWVKFFIYLTDVTTDSGPHTFVKGSHRAGHIPAGLLAKGYTRLEDAEVEAFYPKERLVEFNAPRGTILAEDTRGLHKGKHVAHGDRLMISIQFSNSLFGGSYGRRYLDRIVDPGLEKMVRQCPDIYGNYLLPAMKRGAAR